MRTQRQSGIALLTALFVLILVTALAVGMCWMVMTDQRLGGNNQFRESAFYGAEAGMEKLTADVGTTFANEGSLSTAEMTAMTAAANQPTITGIQFLDPAGNSTYQIMCGSPLVSPCVPVSNNATMLPPSPYAGMQGLITPFTLSVTARGVVTGAEVKLTRQVQVVAIPVFQFGIYSDSDVSFFAGPPFDFGGRTHTNGNLWLAANSGPLYLADKVTVAGQVVRTNLENGTQLTGSNYTGVVSIATTPNPATLPPGPAYSNAQWSPLALTEGSVTNAGNNLNITNVALGTANGGWPAVENRYNGQLNSGVPILTLTTTALGGLVHPISLIRRPTPGASQAVLNEQYFIEASLRILLDDYPAGVTPGTAGACNGADMLSEQTVTATVPVDLATLATNPASIYNGSNNVPNLVIPLPESGAGGSYSATNGYWIQSAKPLITGCLKIEYQNLGGAWTDITPQVLAQGFSGRNINPGNYGVAPPTLPALGSNVAQGPTTNPNVTSKIPCIDPSPSAIIRIARLRDNPSTATAANSYCGNTAAAGTTSATDYWPMALFDSREGTMRTVSTPSQITALGVMYYIELDAGNLAAWINSGAFPLNNATGGFTVYFSDRRGELPDTNVGGVKTGSFGFNDVVNLSNPANGCPNNAIEQGEDLEGDGVLRTYGGAETIPLYPLATGSNIWTLPGLWTGTNMATTGASPIMQGNSVCGAPVLAAPMTAANWPGVEYLDARQARENPPVFFRRALKIVNGQSLNLGTTCGAIPCGLTIASENPVYIQGDYNTPAPTAAGESWGAPTVAAAVAADAITLLSDSWNDVNSFVYPYSTGTAGTRQAVPTAYRTALIAGKGIPFINPAGEVADFGTDGGVHNFLKFLETWSGTPCYYEGSLVSFYYSRQAVGAYKNWGAVYSPPNRNYFFDQNFTLGPQYLPPRTPSLRSINTIGFSQELLATQ
ncbi:MAG: pilus assembly PilX N-terminal domain-containing protein [Candidatus Acidiferrales bacterium]